MKALWSAVLRWLKEYWVAFPMVLLIAIECFAFLNPLPGLSWKAASLAAACGMGVAMTEIISRYRDEPWLAVISPFGVVYCFLNAGVSLAVFGILVRYGSAMGFETTLDAFWKSLAAGFGGTAVLRTRFAVVKGKDNSDISLGLDYVVQTFLGMVDRYIDRARAAKRLQLAMDRSKRLQMLSTRAPNPLNFVEIADRLLTMLLAFQNLTSQEKDELGRVIADYRARTVSDDVKFLALSFLFITCVGEDQFDEMVDSL